MRNHEDSLASIAHARQQANHFPRRTHVHIGEGLVEQQNLGIMQDCPCQRHSLPHALRILADSAGQPWIEADQSQDGLTALAIFDSIQAGKVAQVLHPTHLVVEQ